jgi:hypothetical protein
MTREAIIFVLAIIIVSVIVSFTVEDSYVWVFLVGVALSGALMLRLARR